jgi:hypothetical protein
MNYVSFLKEVRNISGMNIFGCFSINHNGITKKQTLIFVSALLPFLSFSQYKTAEGARFSGIPSLSVKFDKNLIISIEGLLVGFGRGAKATVLVETYKYAFDHHTLGLVDIWERFCFIIYNKNDILNPKIQIGVDGIIGIEHTSIKISVNLSLGRKLEFNFTHGTGLYLPNFGIAARYAIK